MAIISPTTAKTAEEIRAASIAAAQGQQGALGTSDLTGGSSPGIIPGVSNPDATKPPDTSGGGSGRWVNDPITGEMIWKPSNPPVNTPPDKPTTPPADDDKPTLSPAGGGLNPPGSGYWGNDPITGEATWYPTEPAARPSDEPTTPPADNPSIPPADEPSVPPTDTLPRDYAAEMKAALEAQQAAMAAMYNQQAAAQAEQIRQAIAAQTAAANATKADYTNQMNASISTLNAERSALPGKTTIANNQASATGVANAQHIRNALNQMGLLQSGESASQQLTNDVGTATNINNNNLQGQILDTQYVNQIAASEADLASKVKAINDAIALAQANGDTNALAALTAAQSQIGLAAAQNNTTMNEFQYRIGKDATETELAQQQIDNQVAQFAQTLGLSREQLAAQVAQNGALNALAQAGLDQDAAQFAAQLGLSKEQFLAGLQQWALNYNASVGQQEFENGIAVGDITGNYPGDVSSGASRVVINPDGSISVVPVDVIDPEDETPETDVIDASGNLTPDMSGTTTDRSGVRWNNYPVVAPGFVAPSKNDRGDTLVGYRLSYSSHGEKYYVPMYSDQIGSGVVPRGYRKTGDIDGIPTYKEL